MCVAFRSFNSIEKNFDLIAELETTINSDFWYHHGYYQAGEILFKNWYKEYSGAGDHISIDAIIYPVYYCYRHSIEVYMKKLLRTINGQPCEPNHQLKELISQISKVNIKIPRLVQKFVDELHRIDPSFTRFRYDTQKNGNQNETLEVDLIGMVHGFRLVYEFFDKLWNDKYNGDENFINNHDNRFSKYIE